MTLPEAGIALAFLIQFTGLVWGAAQIASSVAALNKTIDQLRKAVNHLEERTHNHEVRVSVLERVVSSPTPRRFDDA